jgi:hypothetical protein
MLIAAGVSDANFEDCFVPYKGKIKDVNVASFMVGNLWHLLHRGEGRTFYERLEEHKATSKTMVPEGQDAVDYLATMNYSSLGSHETNETDAGQT